MKKPEWLRKNTKCDDLFTHNLLHSLNLNTVCESAHCPNKSECFSNHNATFMILGDTCTRNCTFCAVGKDKEKLTAPDKDEPQNIAAAVNELNLDYVVITMVTRDDLPDGGASHLVAVMNELRRKCSPDFFIEVLVSDFQHKQSSIEMIVGNFPLVFNHNVETIERLYPEVRPMADYKKSLSVLKYAKSFDLSLRKVTKADTTDKIIDSRKAKKRLITKSGFMVGLGEKKEEVIKLMKDLRNAQVDVLTIGQYLAPSSKHYPIKDFVHPDTFEEYKNIALNLGFTHCVSGPFVRSSYRANSIINNNKYKEV